MSCINGYKISEDKISPVGEVFKNDSEEEKFEQMVDLFLKGKINYNELMESYPDYDSSMLKKITKYLWKRIN